MPAKKLTQAKQQQQQQQNNLSHWQARGIYMLFIKKNKSLSKNLDKNNKNTNKKVCLIFFAVENQENWVLHTGFLLFLSYKPNTNPQ